MLFLINPQFFSFRDKKDENFTKLQLSALDGRYIATVVSDADENSMLDQNYVNVRTKLNEDGSIGAAIYATARNMYDGTAILVAMPYKGYLIPYNFTGLRIRSAYTTKYTANLSTPTQWPANARIVESNNLPELVEGETNILYLILEPNTNALFDPNHAHHVETMYISFNYAGFSEETDKITTNEHFEISLDVTALPAEGSKRGEIAITAKTAKNRMAPTIMSKLRSKVVTLKNEVDTLNIPYKIADPTPDKGSKKPESHGDKMQRNDRQYTKERSGNQKRDNGRGGYRDNYQKKSYGDNRKNYGRDGKRRGSIHY